MGISLLPAKISQNCVKSNMHSAMCGATHSNNFCYLWCLFHFLTHMPFPTKGLCPSLTLTQLPDCYCKWVLLQRHQCGAGKAQGSQPLPPPQKIMTHVQTTTGIPEVRGRDKWQRADWWYHCNWEGEMQSHSQVKTPRSEGCNETKVGLR